MRGESRKISGMLKRLETLAAKTETQKQGLLDQLRKYPIVEYACKRADVGRSTYYKWREEDREFAKMADGAMKEGASFITDMAKSMLIKNIQNGHPSSIFFWLKARDPQFAEKRHIMAEIIEDKSISPEQAERIANTMWMFNEKKRELFEAEIRKKILEEEGRGR